MGSYSVKLVLLTSTRAGLNKTEDCYLLPRPTQTFGYRSMTTCCIHYSTWAAAGATEAEESAGMPGSVNKTDNCVPFLLTSHTGHGHCTYLHLQL